MTQPIMKVNSINRDSIIRLYQEKDYPISKGINVCGVRSSTQVSDRFDDVLIAFNSKKFIAVRGTTDPGLYYLNNPLSVDGCAIVPEGYHKDIWTKGRHKGQYPALVQRGIVGVIRDYNKDSLVNYSIPPNAIQKGSAGITYKSFVNTLRLYGHIQKTCTYVFTYEGVDYKLQFGYFGINFHMANSNTDSGSIGKWSAGCQVVHNAKDFDKIIKLIYTDSFDKFSYALFNQDDYDRV